MTYVINYETVAKITQGSKQACIYGFSSCLYSVIYDLCQEEGSCLERVYDYRIGDIFEDAGLRSRRTLEGHLMVQIGATSEKRGCFKAALVVLIFENYRRYHERLPLIPLLFCLDIDDNPFPLRPEDMTARTPAGAKKLETPSEVRRCFRLACEFPDEIIRAVANATFKFIKVVKIPREKHILLDFTEMAAPWRHERWEMLWKARKALPKAPRAEKRYPWRNELLGLLRSYTIPPSLVLPSRAAAAHPTLSSVKAAASPSLSSPTPAAQMIMVASASGASDAAALPPAIQPAVSGAAARSAAAPSPRKSGACSCCVIL